MCRDAISRAHSALVGAAIRLAECMGLHRDPTEYNHPPVETHVRRLIWYQLCFLDLRTAEVQGPRACIRREDFSTQFPLNLDDADLVTGKSSDAQEWTDMTFSRIRFECQEMIRVVFVDRLRLEKKTISITQALGKVESFRKAMYAKYGPFFSGPQQTPIQRAAAVMMSLMINRLYILLLHRYHTSVTVRIPDRLRQVLLSTGTQQLEDAIELETSPDLQRWNWYSRAYHNYHTALLLLMEVYYHPMRREADRIWRCLDYVYETPSAPLQQNITRRELVEHRERKARMILTQLRDRMSVYRAMRKMKYPPAMADSHFSGFVTAREPLPDEPAASNSESEPRSTQMDDTHPKSSGVPDDTHRTSSTSTGVPDTHQTASASPDVPDDAHRTSSASPGVPLDAASHADASPPPVPFATFFPGPDVQARVRQNRLHAQVADQPADTSAYQPFHTALDYRAQAQPLQNISPQDSLSRDVRGPSIESEGTRSTDSGGNGLWFMPGGADASAGTATARISNPLAPSPARSEDLPMLDIDWVLSSC
ncbi:hypothetical protein VTN77DRAFT_6507 [Rasamsonia byssochlamydoides]|uniref:uncharacterized protein n=1 Tax=Rasamsonia byssochlamydoides TaxID=89139 RepID=UPI0037429531